MVHGQDGGQLVQAVRNEYEQIVAEIQSDERFCTLSLASELVTWTSPSALCYPVFQERQSEATHEPPSLTATHHPPLDGVAVRLDSVAPQQVSYQSPFPFPITERRRWERGECAGVGCAATPGHGQDSVRKGKEDVQEDKENMTLPKDIESLLELRRKLTMELVWLKQAIVSRQKVH